jgi:cytochrome P450
VFVEEGTIVALNLWGLHHDKDIWGADADEFKPERWIGRPSGWDFVPFLGGPRVCPAREKVLTQAIYVLVRLTRDFSKIENRDPVLQYVETAKMLTESRQGIRVAL